jgi:hypothetical protein
MAPIIYVFKTMPTPDASQYTRFKRYEAISNHAVGSVGSKISRFNTSYTLPILSASSNLLFLSSANKENKFPPPSLPPQNLVADLNNELFLRDGSGDPNGNFVSREFSFSPTRTMNITFTNVPESISELGILGGYGFWAFYADPGVFNINDVVTIKNSINSIQTPDIVYIGTAEYDVIHVTGTFSLTASSVVTLKTINPVTSIRLELG